MEEFVYHVHVCRNVHRRKRDVQADEHQNSKVREDLHDRDVKCNSETKSYHIIIILGMLPTIKNDGLSRLYSLGLAGIYYLVRTF